MHTTGNNQTGRWQFWIDRGGTFTDVVARRPDGSLATNKLLSDNPEQYEDAALQGVRGLLGLAAEDPVPASAVEAIKMGTTVATNALLERRGDRTVLVITKGFGDALRIAYQNRPRLFDRQIVLPEPLYDCVVEVGERVLARGDVIEPVDLDGARGGLRKAYDDGIRSAAIVFLHGYRYPDHERAVARLAREIGFTQVSVSHEVSPLMKLVSRGGTTVVDAYLSPILRRYVERVARFAGDEVRLLFMQSSGGLVDACFFEGKDSILSGPAGGIVGAVRTSSMAGFPQIITFDMGGTSTDVSHYNGEYERVFEAEVGGVHLRGPMMHIHTVAAGGGSILFFDGSRYRVGPESAGADPGPACYRRGGPLTVTDCNVMLGKIRPEFFPKVFGTGADQPIDSGIVERRFSDLAAEIRESTGDTRTPVEVADGFLKIAVENMANAIKKISIERGYDVTGYTLCCFGGAGGQHACLVADALGMTKIFIHPLAGVLSAYGMGLADMRVIRARAVEAVLTESLVRELAAHFEELLAQAQGEMARQGVSEEGMEVFRRAHIRYEGTDSALVVRFSGRSEMVAAFEAEHRQRYGFTAPEKRQIVEAISLEAVAASGTTEEGLLHAPPREGTPEPLARLPVHSAGGERETPFFDRGGLRPGDRVEGPAVIIEASATTVVESGWRAEVTPRSHLVLSRSAPLERSAGVGTEVDPVMLEIFNNLFMSVAEQMGSALANTSISVNMKERLDFSCALFDRHGRLVANAPHIPVHLGSMGESVRTVIGEREGALQPGDVYILNAPYHGGTHLPDVTAVMPVFDEKGEEILFFVASRGHHADIGGITPGSMPPHSKRVEEEGVLIDNFLLVEQDGFREAELRELLSCGRWPARNPSQNVADLKAQVAACERGAHELRKMIDHFGLDIVQAYMRHVQDNAEEQVRRVLDVLHDGASKYPLDNGSAIEVTITIDKEKRSAVIDFTGTSPQQPTNFNAPAAVTRAVVLYVFRTLVDEAIPMNEGCLRPLKIVLPEGCMLNPSFPAAVVAGNVETSQCVANALYGALGLLAGAQGTMNNFTFGNERHQYYETIGGGAGAGPDFDGADAVHTHMTNSRLTDPEVLEWRFPVLVEGFCVRRGSGGRGRHRGGDGVVRRIKFLEPMTAAILSGHREVAPFGAAGGEPGAVGLNWVKCAGLRIELSGTDQIEMKPGDEFIIETPGGGGYGAPPSSDDGPSKSRRV